MAIKSTIKHIRADIKKHRPVDWFAMVILISVAIVVVSVLSSKVEQFGKDMENAAEVRVLRPK